LYKDLHVIPKQTTGICWERNNLRRWSAELLWLSYDVCSIWSTIYLQYTCMEDSCIV